MKKKHEPTNKDFEMRQRFAKQTAKFWRQSKQEQLKPNHKEKTEMDNN